MAVMVPLMGGLIVLLLCGKYLLRTREITETESLIQFLEIHVAFLRL